MTALLNSLFGSLTPLWEMSLTAAYVTAVVVLLRLVLKKRAPKQVLCLLWLVVFARLLIPVNLESPFSILPDEERVQAVQGLPAKLAGVEPSAAPAQTSTPAPVQTPGVTPDQVSHGQTAPSADAVSIFPILSVPGGVGPSAQPQAPDSFPWQGILAAVWLAGAAAMCLYALVSYLSLKSRLYDAIRAEDGAWEHPSIGSPFILGILRPRIYLPAGLWGMPRQFILCHERAHLRRLDHIVKPICWVALALHWFNPAVWLAFILMSRDIEAACDEAVIRQLGPRVKADYSATLLSLATNGRAPAPCPLAFDEGDAKGRIQNVLHYRRPALWIVVVSVIMAIMAAVCLLTDPVSAQSDPDPDASESQSGDSLLDPWMEEVLSGRRHFTSMEGGGVVNIDLLNGAYSPDAPFDSITLSKFAIVDLNRDGISELVLWPSIDGDDSLERISTLGYLVLHRTGDDVYVCSPSYRSFTDIKTDGTFRFSGSAMHNGYASLRFTDSDFSLNEITYCDGVYDENNELKEVYFVDNRSATREEFDAAMSALSAKPGVTWYTYKDGQVKAPAIRAPIPLDDYVVAGPVPDFLDTDQQELYRQALTMYGHIFGANTEAVDDWPDNNGFQYDYQDPSGPEGASYVPATGLYSNWADFEEAVLSVFTQRFWEERNSSVDGRDTYINREGILFYQPAARGSYGYNPNFPETFQLVSQTDDAIDFIMTGYYSEPYPMEGESFEDRDARLEAGWEYSIEYPMRMARTEQGWRFDEIHSAHTDNGLLQFYDRRIPNPDAPPLPTPPEPTPIPEPEVIAELDGMQLLSVGDRFQLTWQGQAFPVGPDISYGDRPWLEDFDEDGQPEALFYGHEDGSYPFTVYDIVDGALVGSSLPDIETEVYPNISLSSVAAYNPATGGLTMTFPWGEGDSRRYVSLHTTLSSDFFAGCEELAAGQPLRMQVTPGSINGMLVPRGLFYRASVALTDGTTTSPEVGYLWFGVLYSDSGFEVRTPEESDFGTDIRA